MRSSLPQDWFISNPVANMHAKIPVKTTKTGVVLRQGTPSAKRPGGTKSCVIRLRLVYAGLAILLP
jgi:hypothetical protein